MSDVVNLRQFRKRKEKVKQNEAAQTNRALHGRTKAEKARDALEKDTQARDLDNKQLVDDSTEIH